jgi:hypothetical protein
MSTRTLGNTSGTSIDNIVNVVVGELPEDFIPDLGITTAKIANLGVTGAKLAAGSVTTDKILDNQVTEAKLHTTLATKINGKAEKTVANTSDDGLMSAADKNALNNTVRLSGGQSINGNKNFLNSIAVTGDINSYKGINILTHTPDSTSTSGRLYNDSGVLKFGGTAVTPVYNNASETNPGFMTAADKVALSNTVNKTGTQLDITGTKAFLNNVTAAGGIASNGLFLNGSQTPNSTASTLYNDGGTLKFDGNEVTPALATASDATKGGVKVGERLSIDNDGVLSADVQPLATASDITKGGVTVGENLTITGDTLSVPEADTNYFGVVKLGSNFYKGSNGKLFVNNAPVASNNAIPGCVTAGSGLSVTTDGTLSVADSIAGAKTFTGAVTANGNFSCHGNLNTHGDVTLGTDTAYPTTNSTVIKGPATLENNLIVNGSSTFGSTVTVDGTTTLKGAVTFDFDDNDSTVSDSPVCLFSGAPSNDEFKITPGLDNSSTAGTELLLGDDTKTWETVRISAGNTSIAAGNFGVQASTYLNGSTCAVAGTLTVGGDTTLNSDLTVGGDTTLNSDLTVSGDTVLGTQNGSNTHHFNGTHFIFDGSSTGNTRNDTPQLEINMIEDSGDANLNYVELIPGHSGHYAGQLFIGKSDKVWNNMRLYAGNFFSNGPWMHSTGNFTVNNGDLTVSGETILKGSLILNADTYGGGNATGTPASSDIQRILPIDDGGHILRVGDPPNSWKQIYHWTSGAQVFKTNSGTTGDHNSHGYQAMKLENGNTYVRHLYASENTEVSKNLTVNGDTTLGVAGTTDGTAVQTTTINGELIINGDKGVGSADTPGVKFTTTDYETSTIIGTVNVRHNNLVSTGLNGNMNIGSSSNRWQSHYIWSLFNRLVYTSEFSVGYNTTNGSDIVLKCSGQGTAASPKKTEINGELTVNGDTVLSGDVTIGTNTTNSITFAGIPKLPIVITLPSSPDDGSMLIHSYLDGSNGIVSKVKVFTALGWVSLN